MPPGITRQRPQPGLRRQRERDPCMTGRSRRALHARRAGRRADARQAGHRSSPRPICKALNAPPPDRPANLTLEVLDTQAASLPSQLSDPAHTVIWLEDAPADLAGAVPARRARGRPGRRHAASSPAGPCRCWTPTRGDRRQAARSRSARARTSCSRISSTATSKWKVEGTAFGKRTRPRHAAQPATRLRLRRQGTGQHLPRTATTRRAG